VVHGAGGEGDRLLGGVLRRGDHRKAAGARRLETLPLGGASIPTTMSPIDGSSYLMGHCPGSLQMLRLIVASETSRSLSSSKAWQGSLKVRSALAFI
jgi:hypothetical protein